MHPAEVLARAGALQARSLEEEKYHKGNRGQLSDVIGPSEPGRAKGADGHASGPKRVN